jgi:hypothetical protein
VRTGGEANSFGGCEEPETMVNPVYMGTLPDMSEADSLFFGKSGNTYDLKLIT